VTDDRIYLLFSGNRDQGNRTKWICGDLILILDWNGNLKELWNLNESIYTFAVDEDKHVIYSHSFSETGNLIKASIQ